MFLIIYELKCNIFINMIYLYACPFVWNAFYNVAQTNLIICLHMILEWYWLNDKGIWLYNIELRNMDCTP